MSNLKVDGYRLKFQDPNSQLPDQVWYKDYVDLDDLKFHAKTLKEKGMTALKAFTLYERSLNIKL